MIDYTNSEMAALIDEHIHSERDRLILKRRLIDGKTIERLSEEFNLSPRQTQTIVTRGQARLFKRLK